MAETTCSAVERPRALFDPAATVHGLRAAQAMLSMGQRFVDVWLFRDPPVAIADPTRWTILPPPGAAAVEVSAAAIDGDHVRLTIAGLPEPTRYRLEISPPAGTDFDPLRVRLPLRLRPECPDLGSCFGTELQAPPVPPSPVHDYTARDWRALRAALVEFHRRLRPDADVSPADPTITLAEIFAHEGDVLHYRLDRVATEAYLSTARLRTSVSRHARLLDYQVGDAVAARATIHVSVPPGAGAGAVAAGDRVLPSDEDRLAFTLDEDRTAVDALGEIALYDWGERGCCLPAGATSAVVVRPAPADGLGAAWLAPGDRVALEIVDPGDVAAHDTWRTRAAPWPHVAGVDAFRTPLPSRQAQVVQLTAVDQIADPLAPSLDVFRISWAPADALVQSFPVSIDTGRGGPEVAVARGNLVEAHHGVLVSGAGDETLQPLFADWADRLAFEDRSDRPLGYLLVGAPEGLARRPDGVPFRLDVRVGLPSGGTVAAEHVAVHLGVAPGQLAVTVEEESWRPPLLRFRTGLLGTDCPPGSTVDATYEAGGGVGANVPANTLTRLERNASGPGLGPSWSPVAGLSARNPVRAAGGVDAEALDNVRRGAPQAFAAFPRRAVLPGDHAAAARELPGVDRASATREWTGAWPLVRTVVDVLGTVEAADLASVTRHLDGLRLLGHEVTVVQGTGVGLVIGLGVCVLPGTDTEQVRRQILARLRPGRDEAPGLFHPDALRLGGTVHTSAVIAAAAAVRGVDAVEITTARRLSEPVGTVHEVLTFEQNEMPVLDDDPSRTERGRFELTMRGGR